MVNVIIGTGTRKAGIATQFSAINWDGSPKTLIVALDPTGDSTRFIEISNQPFTYVPYALYAAHTGVTGTQGPTGSNGLDGKTVLNGTTNPSASIGTNGDFYINTATNSLFGPKANGLWGYGVALVGPQGLQGLQGPAGTNGINGSNGSNGLSAYQIWLNAGNTGTEAQFLTALRGATGAQGPQGIQGIQGATGPQGSAGTNGTNGSNGSNGSNGLSAYQIWLNAGNTGNEAQFVTALRGATGAQGPQGVQGIQGATGLTGATGPQGPAGTNGTNGSNGLSVYQIWLNAGNTGTEAQFLTALRGAAGAQGPQGIQGIQGTAGTNGANGTNGQDGKTILNGTQDPITGTGNNGDFYINTTTNKLFGPKTSGAWGSGVSLVGPQGTAGTNGKNTLVNTTTETAGANCASGGTKIEVGIDANSNGILDSSEVNSSLTKYVCNGVSSSINSNAIVNTINGLETFNNNGVISNWLVPNGVYTIEIYINGSIGGNAGAITPGIYNVNLTGGSGGNFGYGYIKLNVMPNDIITYYIGNNGNNGNNISTVNALVCGGTGYQGQTSYINKNNLSVIKIAGGFGGNGACYNQGYVVSQGTNGTNGYIDILGLEQSGFFPQKIENIYSSQKQTIIIRY
jgi:hypothetical protein